MFSMFTVDRMRSNRLKEQLEILYELEKFFSVTVVKQNIKAVVKSLF